MATPYNLMKSTDLYKLFKELETEKGFAGVVDFTKLDKSTTSWILTNLKQAGLIYERHNKEDKKRKFFGISNDAAEHFAIFLCQAYEKKIKDSNKILATFKDVPGVGAMVTGMEHVNKKHSIVPEHTKRIKEYFKSDTGKKDFNEVLKKMLHKSKAQDFEELYTDIIHEYAKPGLGVIDLQINQEAKGKLTKDTENKNFVTAACVQTIFFDNDVLQLLKQARKEY